MASAEWSSQNNGINDIKSENNNEFFEIVFIPSFSLELKAKHFITSCALYNIEWNKMISRILYNKQKCCFQYEWTIALYALCTMQWQSYYGSSFDFAFALLLRTNFLFMDLVCYYISSVIGIPSHVLLKCIFLVKA